MSDKKTVAPAAKPETPASGNPLKALIGDAKAGADAAPVRTDNGVVKAGPFPVGGTGEVSVIERPVSPGSDKKYLYAEFQPASGGRKKSIPLAAVAVIAEQVGA